jgi:hypothetical protein
LARKVKIPRPKVKELRKLYKSLMTASVGERTEALKVILQWYDQAEPYTDQKVAMDLERAKLKEKIASCRRLEVSRGAHPHESETAFRMAVRMCETYHKNLRPFSIDKAYAKVDLATARMQARREKLENKYRGILKVLRILKPIGVTGDPIGITVTSKLPTGRKFAYSANEIVYSREAIKACQSLLKQRGLLALLFEEIKPMSIAAATKKDSDGHFNRDLDRRVKAYGEMLENLLSFCQQPDAPKRLVRYAGKQPESGDVGSESKPKVNRPQSVANSQKRAFGKRVLIDNLFAEGSATATVYLTLKDGLWHSISDLQKLISADIKSRLRVVNEKIGVQGLYIHEDGKEVRMAKKILGDGPI